jgi:uncharacterized protein
MKVHIPSIPDEGITFSFTKDDGWFRGMQTQRLSELNPDPARGRASVKLLRTNQNVSLSGKIEAEIRPLCSRCGSAFASSLEIPLARHLVPHFGGPREALLSDEEEIELNEEDLEFSFYHNDEIDLEEILAEEVLLAMPMRLLCKESCLGLCPRCGKNWNEGPCSCPPESEMSPFTVLKGIKLKS